MGSYSRSLELKELIDHRLRRSLRRMRMITKTICMEMNSTFMGMKSDFINSSLVSSLFILMNIIFILLPFFIRFLVYQIFSFYFFG
jgi:hypothetical protein